MSASQIILAVVSLLLGGGFARTVIDALKARPERDSVIILPWKELNAALRGQNERLAAELSDARTALREARTEIAALRAAEERLEQQVDRLRAALNAAGISIPP